MKKTCAHGCITHGIYFYLFDAGISNGNCCLSFRSNPHREAWHGLIAGLQKLIYVISYTSCCSGGKKLSKLRRNFKIHRKIQINKHKYPQNRGLNTTILKAVLKTSFAKKRLVVLWLELAVEKSNWGGSEAGWLRFSPSWEWSVSARWW